MTVLVKHGPTARETNEHVSKRIETRGSESQLFPVRFCSLTCTLGPRLMRTVIVWSVSSLGLREAEEGIQEERNTSGPGDPRA